MHISYICKKTVWIPRQCFGLMVSRIDLQFIFVVGGRKCISPISSPNNRTPKRQKSLLTPLLQQHPQPPSPSALLHPPSSPKQACPKKTKKSAQITISKEMRTNIKHICFQQHQVKTLQKNPPSHSNITRLALQATSSPASLPPPPQNPTQHKDVSFHHKTPPLLQNIPLPILPSTLLLPPLPSKPQPHKQKSCRSSNSPSSPPGPTHPQHH